MGNRSSLSIDRNRNRSNNFKESESNISNVHQKQQDCLHHGAILSISRLCENTFCTGSDDKRIGVFQYLLDDSDKHLSSIRYFNGHSKAVNKVLANNDTIWSCSRDLSLKQWNSSTGECLTTIHDAHTLNIGAIALNSTNVIASGSRDYSVKTWDITTTKCIHTYKAPRNIVTSMSFDITGNMLYQGSEDLCIRIWDIRTPSRQPAGHLTGFVYFPLCLDLTSDSTMMCTGSKGFNGIGCEVKIWDLRKQRQVYEYTGHTQDVQSCIYMKNTTRVLSVSKDGTIGVWDTQANQKVAWSVTQKTQYTGATIGDNYIQGDDERLSFVMPAFDGSLTFASISEKMIETAKLSNTPSDDISDSVRLDHISTPYQSSVSEEGT